MALFYGTFGVQYAHRPHPALKVADPSGWITVNAEDYMTAHKFLHWLTDGAFAFLYDEKEFGNELQDFFPRGEIFYVRAPEGFER